jgi:hypothetical protein
MSDLSVANIMAMRATMLDRNASLRACFLQRPVRAPRTARSVQSHLAASPLPFKLLFRTSIPRSSRKTLQPKPMNVVKRPTSLPWLSYKLDLA